MSYPINKLDKQRLNSMYVRPTDKLRLVEYQEDTWIALTDKTGEDVLRLYKVQPNQLADLHALIGRKLGLAPAATMNHLERLRTWLDMILGRDDAEQEQGQEHEQDTPAPVLGTERCPNDQISGGDKRSTKENAVIEVFA